MLKNRIRFLLNAWFFMSCLPLLGLVFSSNQILLNLGLTPFLGPFIIFIEPDTLTEGANATGLINTVGGLLFLSLIALYLITGKHKKAAFYSVLLWNLLGAITVLRYVT